MTPEDIAKRFFPNDKGMADALELEIHRLLEKTTQRIKWLEPCDHDWIDYPAWNPQGGTTIYTTSPQRRCLKCGKIENKWKVTYTAQ